MWDLHFEMMRADQRCQVKLSRPHVEISPSPVAGILQMRNSPWPWFSCEDQHGREGAVLRQHLRGADGEVRGGVPESLRQRPGGQERAGRLLPILQDLSPHQALGYRTSAEVYHGEQGALEGESNIRRCSPGEETESLAGAPGFSLNSALILSK